MDRFYLHHIQGNSARNRWNSLYLCCLWCLWSNSNLSHLSNPIITLVSREIKISLNLATMMSSTTTYYCCTDFIRPACSFFLIWFSDPFTHRHRAMMIRSNILHRELINQSITEYCPAQYSILPGSVLPEKVCYLRQCIIRNSVLPNIVYHMTRYITQRTVLPDKAYSTVYYPKQLFTRHSILPNTVHYLI